MPFGCNSRLCSSCGKRHTDRWADRLAKKLFKGIPYRHFTFSLPEQLRSFIKENRQLQKVISDAASAAIGEMFTRVKHQKIIPGVIAVVHPFGKDLVFKPHIHCISTEGGMTRDGKLVSIGQYLHYDTFHRIWKRIVLCALEEFIPQEMLEILDRTYPKGFCANVNPERIVSHKRLAQYIGRYVRHPAIANSRIEAYNHEAVKFCYKDHTKKVIHKIMLVHEFITAIIQHVPDKHFRLVRYYGIFARAKIRKCRKILQQSIIECKIVEKSFSLRICLCHVCHAEMEFVWYSRKPPPKDMSKITTWLEEQRRA